MSYDKEAKSIFNQYYLRVLQEAEDGGEGESDPDKFKAEGDKTKESDADFTAVKPGDDSSKQSEDQAAQNAGIQPAGIDLNTGMGNPYGAPNTMSQMAPAGSTDLVGTARTANQNQAAAAATAQNLGVQNYNTDTSGLATPQKVDIATGTVGQGTQPAAPSSAPAATAAADNKPKPISDEEKALFKKLHGSDYAPGVGDQRLAELRQAVTQAGGASDVGKVANLAYAQQYAGSDKGNAYAKRAGINPLNPGKPGQPTGGTATAAAQPAATATIPTTSTTTPAQGVNVPSWRNMPGMNQQSQGPTQVNAIKQALQSAGITATDDQISKYAKAMGIS